MNQKTNPEAVILGALFDFAGHMRSTFAHDPFKSVDGFARARKLAADEVPTLTWREQLDSLAADKPLPTDSELVTDLLTLAEAFKDADPNADAKIFDLLSNAARVIRQVDAIESALSAAQQDAERYRFGRYVSRNEDQIAQISDARLEELRDLEDTTVSDEGEHDPVMERMRAVMIEEGLWPLKDGAQ